MGNGASGLTGYIYQQAYMAFRVLGSEAKRLLVEDASGCVKSFVVEGPNTHTGPTWDICFTLEDGSVHLLECKNTAITREDRKVFYRRARKELASGTSADQLTVGWVTDAGKQNGSILDHLRGAAKLAAGDVEVDLQECPSQVNSPEDALGEALHFLCGADDSGNDLPAVSVSDARELMSRLELEYYTHHDLVRSVELLATGVFSTGTGKAIYTYIVGELSTRISRDGQAAYDRESFLTAIGTGTIALEADGLFKDVLSFHSAAAMTEREKPHICWEQLGGQPQSVWSLSERLPGWDSANSSLVVAQSGIGKTSTTWQAFDEQSGRLDPHHVLRFDAAALGSHKLRILPKLCCVLAGVGAIWIAIDGLDEIDTDSRSAWRSTLSTLARLPRVTSLATELRLKLRRG